jgi:hypothetical protein
MKQKSYSTVESHSIILWSNLGIIFLFYFQW